MVTDINGQSFDSDSDTRCDDREGFENRFELIFTKSKLFEIEPIILHLKGLTSGNSCGPDCPFLSISGPKILI